MDFRLETMKGGLPMEIIIAILALLLSNLALIVGFYKLARQSKHRSYNKKK